MKYTFLCWTGDISEISRGNASVLLNDHLKYTFYTLHIQDFMGGLYTICWLVFPLIVKSSFSRDILYIVHRLTYYSPTDLSSQVKQTTGISLNVKGWGEFAKWWSRTHSNGGHRHIAISSCMSRAEWLFRGPEITLNHILANHHILVSKQRFQSQIYIWNHSTS